ncbi:L,D-transpeptidase family protein [Paenirhodobacter sp.]|uniref:L,D-transpeptidase family protein n=1 Tax=Paenirhodobacter sp. TaxID=1965326 RepID=UPI003B4090A0
MTGRFGIGFAALAAAWIGQAAVGAELPVVRTLAPVIYPAPLAPFDLGLAEELADSPALLAAYAARSYAPVWTSAADAGRRAALFRAVEEADGLPARRYRTEELRHAMDTPGNARARGRLEARFARSWARYAQDVSHGVLTPKRVDPGLVRTVARRDVRADLAAFAQAGDPAEWLHGLTPTDPRFLALQQARRDLSRQIAAGGWGKPVPGGTLRPGDKGPAVGALRDRLQKMGYLGPGAPAHYDGAMQKAVQRWQADTGQVADGIAGPATLATLNLPPEDRLRAVNVAMERMRWMNGLDLGARHVWVNITDFTARIVDHGQTVFETVTVVGKNADDYRTPEFSDQMEMIVINPSWHVPRSITVREYLPKMQRDPNAAAQIMLVDAQGREVPRSQVNFAAYDEKTFPYRMRQAPSDDNALGQVKFLFPNPWNIYLHDTPSKRLFNERVRAFSHGCIRIGKPFDLAYELLAPQQPDPEGYFQEILKTGKEKTVRLDPPVPVHLVYFTAWPDGRGGIEYRDDIYGRDAAIWAALEKAGVELTARGD